MRAGLGGRGVQHPGVRGRLTGVGIDRQRILGRGLVLSLGGGVGLEIKVPLGLRPVGRQVEAPVAVVALDRIVDL